MEQPVPILSGARITAREWIITSVIALIAVALSCFPILTGLQQRNGDQYLFANVPDTSDTQVYFAFIDQNAQGHILYKNLFTSEDQRGVLFNPLWLVLGGVERVTHMSAVEVFTATRAVFGWLLVLLIYYLISHFIQRPAWRTVAFTVAVFGGGLGGILLLIYHADPRLVWIQTQTPILRSLTADITYAAGFTWLTLQHSPLFIISQMLLLGAWLRVWRGCSNGWTVIMVALLALIHPYDPALFFGVLLGRLILGILSNRLSRNDVLHALRQIGVLLLAMIPAVIYYVFAILADPVIRQWFHQNFLLSPPLTSLIGGYGILSLLAFLGSRRAFRGTPPSFLLVTWLVSALLLTYLPLIPFQAKMISLLNVPIALLSVFAVQGIFAKYRHGISRIVVTVLCGLSICITFSTVIVFPFRVAASQRAERTYHYASSSLIDALQWARNTTPPTSVILGDFFTDNLVPQFAARTAYIGHNIQTIQYQQKLYLVRHWFYGSNGDVERKEAFLRDQHINFVFWGPNEKKRGLFSPDELPSLHLVHQEGDIGVYQVQ